MIVSLLFGSLCLLFVSLLLTTVGANEDVVFRWTSTGGGWRSMFACMGYANLFQQAGLWNDTHSHLTAVSTNSGGSWFSTQAFYSSVFYQATAMAPSPQDVQQFAIQWMNAYWTVASNFTQHEICHNILQDLMGGSSSTNSTTTNTTSNMDPLLEEFSEFCDMLVEYDGDWAAFIDEMFRAAGLAYGDTDMAHRILTPENRIGPLQQTDLLVQSALLANSRIRGNSTTNNNNTTSVNDTTVYLGPTTANDIYTLTLSAAYTVNTTMNGFVYNIGGSNNNNNNTLDTYSDLTSSEFNFGDFEDDFFLYPATENPAIAVPTDLPKGGPLREEFGGPSETFLVQIASVTSAAMGPFSPAGPSTFAQSLSKMRSAFDDDFVTRAIFDRAADRLYNSPMFDKFAVCSQWPEPCLESDGLFIDGGLVDNAAIPINIAQYHNSEASDLEKTLKIVVTNNNDDNWGSDRMNTQILQYFSNDMNEGIAPGDFIWYEALPLPFRSPQIFQDYMDVTTLDSLVVPVEGTTFTTALINVTTTNNPAFGIREGQKVELLWINLNSPITTFLVGKTIIEQMTEPVGQMVYDIASNQELLKRVRDFFGTASTQNETSDSTGAGDTSDSSSIPDDTSDSSVPDEDSSSSESTAATRRALLAFVSLFLTVGLLLL